MAYKARRTRDLQGEVKAGTGVRVTEQTKPDGTKVYTLENTAPGSEYFTTERTEGGWAILNQDNNIVIASSSEFDFNDKGVTFFTKDGEPFAIIVGTQAQGNTELKIIDANGNEVIVIGTGGIRVNDATNHDKTVTLQPGIVQLTNEGGNTTVEISNSDIYIYNNDEGNDNFIINHSDDCRVYIRNRYGNDGVLIETYEDKPATVKICDQDGNEILNSDSVVDMVNSLMVANFYTRLLSDDGSSYMTLNDVADTVIDQQPVAGNDYYGTNEIDYFGTLMTGFEIYKSGVYHIHLRWGIQVFDDTDITLYFMRQRNGDVESVGEYERDINLPGGWSHTKETDVIIELNAGDTIAPMWEGGSSGTITGVELTAMVTIQKLR